MNIIFSEKKKYLKTTKCVCIVYTYVDCRYNLYFVYFNKIYMGIRILFETSTQT